MCGFMTCLTPSDCNFCRALSALPERPVFLRRVCVYTRVAPERCACGFARAISWPQHTTDVQCVYARINTYLCTRYVKHRMRNIYQDLRCLDPSGRHAYPMRAQWPTRINPSGKSETRGPLIFVSDRDRSWYLMERACSVCYYCRLNFIFCALSGDIITWDWWALFLRPLIMNTHTSSFSVITREIRIIIT